MDFFYRSLSSPVGRHCNEGALNSSFKGQNVFFYTFICFICFFTINKRYGCVGVKYQEGNQLYVRYQSNGEGDINQVMSV